MKNYEKAITFNNKIGHSSKDYPPIKIFIQGMINSLIQLRIILLKIKHIKDKIMLNSKKDLL